MNLFALFVSLLISLDLEAIQIIVRSKKFLNCFISKLSLAFTCYSGLSTIRPLYQTVTCLMRPKCVCINYHLLTSSANPDQVSVILTETLHTSSKSSGSTFSQFCENAIIIGNVTNEQGLMLAQCVSTNNFCSK